MRSHPASAPYIVRVSFGGVGEDGVGGDEEAVALDPNGMWQVSYGRGWLATVWVVQFYEVIESVFRVGLASLGREDLVWCWRLVGVDSLRPAEIGLSVMRY